MDINGYQWISMDIMIWKMLMWCVCPIFWVMPSFERFSLENACRFSKMFFHSDSGFFAADDGGFKTRFVLPSGNLT